MSARNCNSCSITLPLDLTECPACGAETIYTVTEWADPKWREKVDDMIESTVILANRARRLREAGCDWDTALDLAGRHSTVGGYQVDVTEFENLLKAGCPIATAVRILG